MPTKLAAFMVANPSYGPVESAVEMLLGGEAWDTAAAITPSDTVDLTVPTKAIYVGVAGDVKVNMGASGTGITFKAVPVGTFEIKASRVYSTGTTATNLVALN